MAKLPNPIDKYVGSRVRERRMILGMSQMKLADALGITFQQVQKYEKGTNRVSASRLQQIVHILQVPVQFLFDGAPGQRNTSGDPPRADYVSDFVAMPDGLALMKAFIRLKGGPMRWSVVRLVKEISER